MINSAQIRERLTSRNLVFQSQPGPNGTEAFFIPYAAQHAQKHVMVIRSVEEFSIVQIVVIDIYLLKPETPNYLAALAYVSELNGLLLVGAFATNRETGELRFNYNLPQSLVTPENFLAIYDEIAPKILASCDDAYSEVNRICTTSQLSALPSAPTLTPHTEIGTREQP